LREAHVRHAGAHRVKLARERETVSEVRGAVAAGGELHLRQLEARDRVAPVRGEMRLQKRDGFTLAPQLE